MAGEEVLAFSRQPIVHPKDRGAAWVSKEVDSDLSCCGMWECHNYCAPQILLLTKWQELLRRSKGGERQPLKSQFHNANVHGLRGNSHNA